VAKCFRHDLYGDDLTVALNAQRDAFIFQHVAQAFVTHTNGLVLNQDAITGLKPCAGRWAVRVDADYTGIFRRAELPTCRDAQFLRVTLFRVQRHADIATRLGAEGGILAQDRPPHAHKAFCQCCLSRQRLIFLQNGFCAQLWGVDIR
jgi:hypothetical protein